MLVNEIARATQDVLKGDTSAVGTLGKELSALQRLVGASIQALRNAQVGIMTWKEKRTEKYPTRFSVLVYLSRIICECRIPFSLSLLLLLLRLKMICESKHIYQHLLIALILRHQEVEVESCDMQFSSVVGELDVSFKVMAVSKMHMHIAHSAMIAPFAVKPSWHAPAEMRCIILMRYHNGCAY